MLQLCDVSRLEKILFPILLLILVALISPSAAPLLGLFCFGNLMQGSGVVDRLFDTVQNSLINIVTILLGLSVGSKLIAEQFLVAETPSIFLLGMVAFEIDTASEVIMATIMNVFAVHKINPLIGAAGVSAVPKAASVANKVGLQSSPNNFLPTHAMGHDVEGVIGSAIAAGVLIEFAY